MGGIVWLNRILWTAVEVMIAVAGIGDRRIDGGIDVASCRQQHARNGSLVESSRESTGKLQGIVAGDDV
jgi:hypothetical protein